MENVTMSANDVKKDLYKSKAMAKMSHYTSGNLYYTVELSDGTYQFPIATIETIAVNSMGLKVEKGTEKIDIEIRTIYEDAPALFIEDKEEKKHVEATCKILSTDLGTTSFDAEMKGSDLNRWIAKAIEKGEFIKIK